MGTATFAKDNRTLLENYDQNSNFYEYPERKEILKTFGPISLSRRLYLSKICQKFFIFRWCANRNAEEAVIARLEPRFDDSA